MISIAMLLVAAAIFSLGMVVLGRERANHVALSFLALTTTISLWLTSIASMQYASNPFLLARITYVGVALIPAAVLQFTMSLLDVTRQRRRTLIAAWIAGVGFAVLFTTTRTLLSGVLRYSWGVYPHLTEASVSFLAYFAIVLAGALFLLASARPHSERERRRNRAILLALGVGYLASIDYVPAFGIDVYPLGCLAIFGFIVLIARSIFVYSLADLNPAFVADRLLQTMHGGVIVVDTVGRVRVANRVATQLLGWSDDEMRHLDLPALLGMQRLPITDSESFAHHSITRNRVVQWKRRDGSQVELSLSASALRDEEGNALGILYAISESEYKATHDLLTSLPNRARFQTLFEESKDQIVATGRIPAVLFIDLDGFKAVNDEHGHAAGDALLQMMAKRVRNCIRGDDVLARYAGDEFVLRVDLARVDDATFVASKLLRVISEPYAMEDKQITVGASIGAAFYPADGKSADELLRAADGAMYGAKRAGKGRVQIARPRTDTQAPPPYAVNATA